MRTEENAPLRVLLIGMLLIGATTGCVAFLVAEGILRLTAAHAAGAGVALLLVALLAAAISALGPKYRPTPFLTPLSAGVFALLFATTVVYAAHTQASNRARATVASEATMPTPPMKRPVKTEPVIEKAEVPPEAVPDERTVRLLDAGFGNKAEDRMPIGPFMPQLPPLPSAPPGDVANAAPADQPAEELPPADEETPEVMASAPADDPAPPAAERATPAKKTAIVPTPVVAPGDPALANLKVTFDPTGPVDEKAAGAPVAVAAADKPRTPATPPLPRIRPCGGDAPACR